MLRPVGANRVGDPEHQGDLGPDDHQVDIELPRQRSDIRAVDHIHGVLLGDACGAGISWGTEQLPDLGIAAQGQQEGVFTGTGADHEYAHGGTDYGAPTENALSALNVATVA